MEVKLSLNLLVKRRKIKTNEEKISYRRKVMIKPERK